jgi:Ca2+-binding RTX toxin-like protein
MTRIYFIGNSVTDTINYRGLDNIAESQGRSHEWGRHMIPGAPLNWIWSHPDQGFQESPYGYYPTALANYQWDALSLQPFDRSLDGQEGDLAMANNFINLAKTRSPNLQVYIYQRWPRKQDNNPNPTAADWDAMWLSNYTGGWQNTESRSYYDTLAQSLRSAHADLPPTQLVRVGEVLYALNQRMKSGQVPGYTSIWDLYTDHVHLNNVGSYIVGATYYATLYRNTPLSIPIPSDYGTVPAATAQIIQQTIWDVVSADRSLGGSTVLPLPPANPTFFLADTTVTEGQDRTAQIAVTLSKASSETITVNYSTADGTAVQGSDYEATSGTLTFAPGQTRQTISVPILADGTPEVNETFTINFSNPTGSAELSDQQATVTIGDVIQSAVSITLPEGIRNLVLIGNDPINGTGNSGNNSIAGNGNNNILDGGAGYDTLQGGAGNDTYLVESIWWDLVVETENAGTDLVMSLGNYVLPVNVENLTLIGTEDANATGNGMDNRIEGNSGNNVLDGAAGNDTLEGKAGNDTYVVDSAGDRTIEADGQGVDTVQTTVDYSLSDQIEQLVLMGRASINGRGNSLDNRMKGNPGNNQIAGGDGQDTLLGAEGNDTLVGDAGQDWLNGGAGADQLMGGTGADRFVYAGAALAEISVQSSLAAPDQIADFNVKAGDRIQLDLDNNPATPDRPKGLFNAGQIKFKVKLGKAGDKGKRRTVRTLEEAVQMAYRDENHRAKGRQSLQIGEAVSFGWRGQTYLSVNLGSKGFGPTEDLLIQIGGGPANVNSERGKLPMGSFFAG